MSFTFQELALLIVLRPAKAIEIAYWRVTGRRLRARARLKDAVAALPFAYHRWLLKCARVDRAILLANRSAPTCEIAIHLHLAADSRMEDAVEAIASVTGQSRRHWTLLISTADGAIQRLPEDPRIIVVNGHYQSYTEGLTAALYATEADYLVPLRLDCRLPSTALAAYAAHLSFEQDRKPSIFYGDQDEIEAGGRRGHPWFKPEWDPEMFLSQDYLSVACAIPIAPARDAICVRDDDVGVYGLLLDMTMRGIEVEHIPRIVASTPPALWSEASPARLDLLRATLRVSAGADVTAGPFGTATIKWPLPEILPLVSIIVPTRNRMTLLKSCVEGVLECTHYPNLELIVADNGSTEPEALDYLAGISGDPRVRIISWPHAFNYAAINNFAVASTRGRLLCLLNNDIEIIDANWLSELVRYAVRPDAGAVGARLLYPDRSVQHAGVVVGLGNAAGHAHRGLPEGEAGYFAHALVARHSAAVTAACLMVKREKFDAVGGFDERHLRVAYNDVDLCMKLRAGGAINFYVPSAVLVHHESKSRGLDMAPEHFDRYMQELKTLQQRWATETFLDPAHHPVLDRSAEIFTPAFPSPTKERTFS